MKTERLLGQCSDPVLLIPIKVKQNIFVIAVHEREIYESAKLKNVLKNAPYTNNCIV
jgi:hypothetical protein